MISNLTHFHNRLWFHTESRLVPRSEEASLQLFDTLPLVIEFPIGIAVSCVKTVNIVLSCCITGVFPSSVFDPKEDFSHVVQDARAWGKPRRCRR